MKIRYFIINYLFNNLVSKSFASSEIFIPNLFRSGPGALSIFLNKSASEVPSKG